MEQNNDASVNNHLQDVPVNGYLSDKIIICITGAVSFYREGKLHRAALLSLSEHSARFLSFTAVAPKIIKGRTGEYYLQTTYGKSKCRGITRKIFCSNPAIIWEIEFIELSENDNDPIRQILDATFKKKQPARSMESMMAFAPALISCKS